jgi:signal transduction histidine kinase/HD-like signal output (HDOD) protein
MTPKALDLRDRLLVARLPAMPQILTRLLWLCNEEDVNLADLSALASHDAGVAARILSVANSSAYYHGGRKLGLDQALGVLGLDLFKSLVISQSVLQVFNQFAGIGGIDLRNFWTHSLRSAVLARELAVCAGYSRPDEAYLAGLLHDVGRLALMSTAPREYAPLFASSDDDQVCAREVASLELTHAEAGAWLAERWQFDALLADSILYHHESAERLAGTHPLLCLTALAHRLADQAGEDADTIALREACGIPGTALATVLPSAAAQGRRVADALGIDLAAPAASGTPGSPPSPEAGELAGAVRDVALAQDARCLLACHESEAAIVEALLQSTGALFNVQEVVFLRHEDTASVLAGVAVGRHAAGAPDIRIFLAGGGALAEAAAHNQLLRLSTADGNLRVGEARLLRLLGTPALVALPLCIAGQCRGMLVAGCTPAQAAALEAQKHLLHLFARQAVQVLVDCQTRTAAAAARLVEVGEQHRLAVRKLVHEVNNPLGIIRNYLFLLESKLSRGEAPADEIAVLGDEIDRVGRLVGRMGAAQADADEPAGIALGTVVRQAVALFEKSGLLASGTTIAVELPDDLPVLPGDPDLLRQIVDNLLKNAAEAMPGGGRITIATTGEVNRGGKGFLELLVRDTGPGLPAAVRAQLFTPVSSAKGAGHGLGLSVVRDLVTRLGGEIQCRSGAAGTTFEIQLPLPTAGAS